MIRVRLSDFAETIEEAMRGCNGSCRVTIPEGELEFTLRYDDEMIPIFTGVEFLGEKETYLRPSEVSVSDVDLLPSAETEEELLVIPDYEFDAEKIFS